MTLAEDTLEIDYVVYEIILKAILEVEDDQQWVQLVHSLSDGQ